MHIRPLTACSPRALGVRRQTSLPSGLVLLAAMFLLIPRSAETLPALSIAFGNTGLSSINYGGTEFLANGDFRLDEVAFLNPDSTVSDGSTASAVTVNPSLGTQTRTYNWGSIVTSYSVIGSNRLSLAVTVNNQSPNTIQRIWMEPLSVRFPSSPVEFGPGYPLITDTVQQPAVQEMTYNSGMLVVAVDDILKPLQIGFPYAYDGPANTVFPITLNTDRIASYCDCFRTINRPIPGNSTDTFLFSLRFGGPGSTTVGLASDVYQNFAAAFPQTSFWPDRRPIASLHLASWPNGSSAFALNPRGWLNDAGIDVTTATGLANLQQRLLSYADYSISILRSMNAQGMITWDIEGEQFPGFVGDPTITATVAPEMAGLADSYFARFRDAGFRVGVAIRPEQVILSADGASIQENFVADPLGALLPKISYAHSRWGATLFYIDSNVIDWNNQHPIDPLIFQTLHNLYPDSLFVPEHSDAQYWAYSAPYLQLNQGFTSTPAGVRFMYPNAFTVISTADAAIQQNFNSLVTAVQQGDVLLFRGWWNDPDNALDQSIYQTAGLSSPLVVSVAPHFAATGRGQTVQLTATVAGNGNQAVTWSLDSGGAGSLSPTGLYTAPASLGSTQTVTIRATSAADPSKSGSASITVGPVVAVSLLPQNNAIGPKQLLQFTAAVSGNTNQQVTWTLLSGPGSLSSSGLYTAPASIASGQTVAVQAVSVADATKSATANFTLVPAFSVALNPTSASLTAGQTLQFTPVVTGNANQQVTWSLLPAGLGTISSSGLYTAPASITAQQSVIVKASSAADPTKFANATVTLNPVVAVSLLPTTGSLTASQTMQFTPTVTGTANQQVTWSISPSGLGTISAAGLYSAPASIASQQTVIVKATSAADTTKSGTATVTLNPSAPPPSCPAPAANAFTACYFNDTNFNGLAFSRVDPQINFNWGTGGPGQGVGPYNFSVRWRGNFTLPAGTYTFTLSTDDGSTLYIDGQQVINEAGIHAAFATSQTITLTAGTHLIAVDYFQAGGGASASLTWIVPTISVGIGPTTQSLTAGQTLQFTASVSGSANQQVTWSSSPAGLGAISPSGLYTAPAVIATNQTVTVQSTSAADNSKNATTSLTLQPSVSPMAPSGASCALPVTHAFTGCYYNDTTFGASGAPPFTRMDTQINFDWGTSGPGLGTGSGIGAYNFSVRWQGKFTFNGGPYTFTMSTDDGSILYIDGAAVMNEWGQHPAYSTSQTINLAPGTHLLELDYFQIWGGASAALSWSPLQ